MEALCEEGNFRYSVETPTDKPYQFTDNAKEISAQTDLTVYDMETNSRCNVEFKAGGKSIKSGETNDDANVFPIYKDVLKLMCEPVKWGLWFHLLESANSATIPKLLEVIREQIRKVREENYKDIEPKGLTLHVCMLRHGFSFQKDLRLPIDAEKLKDHLDVCLEVSQTPPKLREGKNLNGWKLHRKCSRERQHQPME